MLTVTNHPDHPARGLYQEKKSDFIGLACHVDSLDQCQDLVDRVKGDNPKARHVAWAALVGAEQGRAAERMSDDGEPAGTAGRPILNLLQQSGTSFCLITVTRYFGGILLGTGGLVRAYSAAASAALSAAAKAPLTLSQTYLFRLTYPQHDRLRRLLEQAGGKVRSEEFTDRVNLWAQVPLAGKEAFEAAVDSAFQGAVAGQELERTVQVGSGI